MIKKDAQAKLASDTAAKGHRHSISSASGEYLAPFNDNFSSGAAAAAASNGAKMNKSVSHSHLNQTATNNDEQRFSLVNKKKEKWDLDKSECLVVSFLNANPNY